MDLLTIVTFFPLVGVILLLFIPKDKIDTIKQMSLIIAFITFLLSLWVYSAFEVNADVIQLQVEKSWIQMGPINIKYYLGIDGISLLLILLTTFLMIPSILISWKSINTGVKGYFISLLLLETGMIGVFCALDLFMFYVFWEVMLIPMYFLIGMWGGPRKLYAAIKFVLFTMFGSLLMLVGIIYILFQYQAQTGMMTFDIIELIDHLSLTGVEQMWLFGAFALAFAIKVPLFPFHTWLPDAHVQAPTAGSVILAGVLLKMGTYGFVRICMPMFPDATVAFVPYISILSIIAIIYGAMVAMVQKDIKSLVAFSSVSHMGFVMLGLFALNEQAIAGATIQMINHGISTGALFLLVGMIYERRHSRMIEDFGGITKIMPLFTVIFMIVTLSSIGLPLTNGFVGEFMILLGTFKANKWYAVFAASGVILSACYMLWMFQRVFFGKLDNPENKNLTDIDWRERIILIPLLVMIFWIGIYPTPFIKIIEPSVRNLVEKVGRSMTVDEINTESMDNYTVIEDNRVEVTNFNLSEDDLNE